MINKILERQQSEWLINSLEEEFDKVELNKKLLLVLMNIKSERVYERKN